jgi:transketolase
MSHADLQLIANVIRGLSMDAIDAANSGHPGLPLGCAELAAVLYGKMLRHNPQSPQWINRDRFILSAGHGSMLLYAVLHLAGYPVTVDHIKRFRQYHSPTAGHPEFREIPGIETTTGPLGQGVATAIGMALGQKMAAAHLELDQTSLLDAKVFVLAGDGCLMEGITAEASSLAGHLCLDNVVLIYDSNNICLDGETKECFTEDTALRYKSYGWDVITIDGHNIPEIEDAFSKVRDQKKPTLIIAKTTIGKGSPSYQGKNDAHGKAFGPQESILTKKALGLPEDKLFYVPEAVYTFFDARQQELQQQEEAWHKTLEKWSQENPDKRLILDSLQGQLISSSTMEAIKTLDLKSGLATRQISGQILQKLCEVLPFLIGGSADLSSSDNTFMKAGGVVSASHFGAKNIKFGVREFAMAAMVSGLALQGMWLPFCGTFMTFSDYMKNAIRLAALMNLHVIYQFTHDSIFLGEDGPTHQPVEHLASLRSIPNLTVIRPADVNEVKGAWMYALSHTSPTALILSRQGLPNLDTTSPDAVFKGGYVIKEGSKPTIDFCILATGSELHLALNVASELENKGRSVRVISMVSFEIFDQQNDVYKQSVLGGDVKRYVSIEAQSSFGWHKYIGRDGIAISIDSFGLSAPASDLAKHFGFTVPDIVQKLVNT